MRNGYVDAFVVCPLYIREESNEIRKIHCEGYHKGVYMQMYFRKKEQKRVHKKKYCKSLEGHKECPVFKGVNACKECCDE